MRFTLCTTGLALHVSGDIAQKHDLALEGCGKLQFALSQVQVERAGMVDTGSVNGDWMGWWCWRGGDTAGDSRRTRSEGWGGGGGGGLGAERAPNRAGDVGTGLVGVVEEGEGDGNHGGGRGDRGCL